MQHDDGRETPPCRMSREPRFECHFQPNWLRQFIGQREPEIDGCQPVGDLFPRYTHGRMRGPPGTLPVPQPFGDRITWRNLAVAGDDFARQYFQVLS